MLSTTATIRISNLRLRTFIGFNPEERSKQQDIVVNASIRHRLQPGIVDDAVSAALNYKTITKHIIRHVAASSDFLVEKLVSGHTVHLLVRIDGEPFTSYAGDGLIVSQGQPGQPLHKRSGAVSNLHAVAKAVHGH